MANPMQIALLIVPVLCTVLLAAFIHMRFGRFERWVEEGRAEENEKEARLRGRERRVLAATLEGELAENRNRIEAFISIYGDLLANLKNPKETPKYQQGGDIVQKHPSFSRAVFEANAGKLSLFDMKFSAQLSKLYAALPREHQYLTIQPNDKLPSVIGIVEKALREAQAYLEPVEAARAALEKMADEGG